MLLKETADKCPKDSSEVEEEFPQLVPAICETRDEYYASYNDVEVHRLMMHSESVLLFL